MLTLDKSGFDFLEREREKKGEKRKEKGRRSSVLFIECSLLSDCVTLQVASVILAKLQRRNINVGPCYYLFTVRQANDFSPPGARSSSVFKPIIGEEMNKEIALLDSRRIKTLHCVDPLLLSECEYRIPGDPSIDRSIDRSVGNDSTRTSTGPFYVKFNVHAAKL